MSTTTTNMALTKPATTDTADIGVINTNMDTLDGHYHNGGSQGVAVKVVQSGAVSARPNPTAGQLYVSTEGPSLHVASASTWVQLGASPSNMVVNGGFEVWQRGGGSFTPNNAFTADRWYLSNSSSTTTLSRITSTIGSKGYSAQMVYGHQTSGTGGLNQKLEVFTQLVGKTVTFSAKVKSTVAGTVLLKLDDGTASTTSSANAGTGEETLSVTRTIAAGATQIIASFVWSVGSCTTEINDAVIVIGAVPADYLPLTPAEEWERCQRYFELHAGVNGSVPRIDTYNGAANEEPTVTVMFNTVKAATPTLTKEGNWAVSGFRTSDPALGGPSLSGYYLTALSSAAGAHYAFPNGSDDIINAVAEP